MLHQVVEIFEESRYLSLTRGFMSVKARDELVAQVPLDDIAVVLLSAHSITFSKPLLAALADQGSIVVICGKNYAPSAMQLPVYGNYQQAAVIKSQIDASTPFKKNVWKRIVEEKISNQAKVLQETGKKVEATKLLHISRTVRSGDPDNREAYAARLYWKNLFGQDFTRDKDGDGINGLLNYGYAVVRASMIRSLCCSGLLPALGLYHDNKLNAFCLADDLFEPFRPIVDSIVHTLVSNEIEEVTPDAKKALIDVLWIKMKTTEGYSPLFQALQYYANSLVKCLKSKKPEIQIPVWEGQYESVSRDEQV